MACEFLFHLLLLLLGAGHIRFLYANFYIPGLPKRALVMPGDINIGAILSISEYSKSDPCGDVILSTRNVHYVDAITYAVQQINQDASFLNGTRLGLIILDDCFKETTTIAQAMRMVPLYRMDNGELCNATFIGDPLNFHVNSSDLQTSFDVIGVIGARRSSSSIAASLLLGPTQVPLISFTSTSDELSNKEIHPYFLRVVPPDKYQAQAIVDFIDIHGWSYMSAIYEEGSYGELGFKKVKEEADKRGICIATAQRLKLNLDASGYRRVINELLKHPNAKVVVSFGGVTSAYGIFDAIKELRAERKFIWIGSDTWSGIISSLPNGSRSSLGAFAISFFSTEVPGLYEYYANSIPATSPNPWFLELWEEHFGCSLVNNTCDPEHRLSFLNDFKIASNVASAVDAAYTYAHALSRIINEHCPGVKGKPAATCIQRYRGHLLRYLQTTHFEGLTGKIKFDQSGNLLGKYRIQQAVVSADNKVVEVAVASYDISTNETTMTGNESWLYFEFPNAQPESVCSKPCKVGEFIIRKELPCCWECRRCRDNEIIVGEGTSCLACPLFDWPDPETNLTSCKAIPPDYVRWTSPVALLIAIFAGIFAIITVGILTFYVQRKDAQIIKASSRELSYLQLIAILFGYLTILVILAKPSGATCQTGYFLFCLSFNALYAPMFVKALRVHRIFQSGKTNQRPRYTSPRSQILFSMILIFIQILVCLSISIISTPDAVLTQSVSTRNYVELSCHLTTAGLGSFLAYNLFLVSLCSVLAFKTRTLPDNFNESRFVSMCVSTTLVIWLAFMPAYFTAMQKSIQTLLLALALLLNHNTALIFLFAPKVYAVLYTSQEQAAGTTSTMVTSAPNGVRTNLTMTTRVNAIFPSSFPASCPCVSTTLVIWLAFMPAYFTAMQKSIQTLLLALALLLNHNTALIFLFAPKVYAVLYTSQVQAAGATSTMVTSAPNGVRTNLTMTTRVNAIFPSS